MVPNPNPNPNPKIQTLTLTATPNQAWKELGVEEKKQWESQAPEYAAVEPLPDRGIMLEAVKHDGLALERS